jgi:hypothetical protein
MMSLPCKTMGFTATLFVLITQEPVKQDDGTGNDINGKALLVGTQIQQLRRPNL